MRSCQTFWPPSHGGRFGKFAPPAMMRAPFDVPANAPAKPIESGNAGSSSNFTAATGRGSPAHADSAGSSNVNRKMIARTMMLATVMLFASAAKCIAALPTIEWDASTMQLVVEGGDYGRMAGPGDGRIACASARDSKMWIRPSSDDGATWAE